MIKIAEKKLNKQQLEAVRHKKGPLLIIAGAGTGKTTVVTERIKFLIEKDLAKPSEILALTFTEKASREMEERVDIAMPYGYTQMWISTFHSFCDRILRDEALQIGLNPKYKLLTSAESIQLVRDNLFKFKLKYFRPLGNPTKFVSGILQHFSRLQDENISPLEYLRWANTQRTTRDKKTDEQKLELDKWLELANAYVAYDKLKTKEGLMDFGDLIAKTVLLFKKRSNVLKQYQKKFKYILVDEFQDTNIAQNELVKLLAGKDKNITVVADDDQSIYKWRGAAISNVVQFRKNFPKTKIVTLTKNYRSAQEILDKAYDLIQHNNPNRLEVVENIDKKLKAESQKQNAEIKFIHSDRVENEADEVAKEIAQLTADRTTSDGGRVKQSETSDSSDVDRYEFRDIAILVRANNHAEPFIRAFQRHGIPHQFLGPGKLFKQAEIVDLISYLKVLFDFDDSVAFLNVLSIEHFDISAKDLVKIGGYARRYNSSLFEACEKIDEISVSDDTKKRIQKLLKLIDKHLKFVSKETAGQILYDFLQDTGLIQKLINPDSPQAEEKVKNISKFFDKLKSYEANHEDASVSAVCSWLELLSELGESPLATDTDWTEVDAVNILTIHSSKGLEFPIVFLVNLVSQRFPTMNRREQIPIPEKLVKEILPEGDFHIQEERRLFYVGMTRAMSKLYLTAANFYGEGKRQKKLSPFIFEALGNEAISSEQSTDDSLQLSFLDYKSDQDKTSENVDRRQKTVDKQKIHIDFLSYSQIQTFQVCPLHYKLKYILKVPTAPTAPLSFGISIHEALNDFYLAVKNGKRATKKLMDNVLQNNWKRIGYRNKTHEKKMYEKGENYLSDFLKVGFNPKSLPLALEQSFVVGLNPTSRKATRGQLPQRQLKIGGKIDRVDLWKPASVKPSSTTARQGIEIIDYKTGANIPTQKQIDKDFQLTFYALAASKIVDPPFNKKPSEIALSLYYLEEQKKLTTTRTQAQLDEAEIEIFKWREKIEKSDFACSGHIFCKNCEFSLMCRADSG